MPAVAQAAIASGTSSRKGSAKANRPSHCSGNCCGDDGKASVVVHAATPRTRSPCAAERSLGEEARRALADALANGSIVLTDVSRDKFGGRVVASVRILRENGGDDLAQLMLAGGYGRPYAGGRRGPDACGS